MATGFMQRWKGKIAAKVAHFLTGGLYLDGKAAILPYTNAGVPVNGGSGTLAGIAVKGALLLDLTNAVLYQNTNTKASPTWTALTTATGAGTYTGTFDGTIGGSTPAAASVTDLTVTGEVEVSTHNTITAHAGGGRTSAVALDKQVNRISVCATTADSVVLPAAVAGDFRAVFNDGAAAAQIFADGSDTIDDVAGATGVPLTNAKRAIYFCLTTGAWVSAQLGAASA